MSAATRIPIVTIFCVVLIASSTRASQLAGSLSGPVVGYLFDKNAGKLRPVKGMLGSATMGEPLESGFAISQVLPLDSRYGIVSTDANTEAVVLTLDGGPSPPVPIYGVPANPTRVVASVQGTAAAFYYAETREVRMVTGLPQEPHQVAVLRMDKPLTQMAVHYDGTAFVYSVTEGEGEAVYAWSASSGNARFATSAVSVSSIVITRGGDAIVTDRAANEVFAIWDPSGGAVRKLLAGAKDGVSEPVGLAVSAVNTIYIANTESVIVLDSNGRFLKAHSCNCAISGLYPFHEAVFRLTDDPRRTTFLLDIRSPDERILFVPPSEE